MIYFQEESVNQISLQRNLLKNNDREMKYISASNRIVYSDASETRYDVQTGNGVPIDVWEEIDRKKSSTWRKLVAVKREF